MTIAAQPQSDLARARDQRGEVTALDHLPGGLVELTVRLPHLAAHVRPGEFAQLRCAPGVVPLLRRPMSVAWVDDDECSFVFEVVGEGTARLASLHPGDALDVLGPLGVGFTLPAVSGTLLCVSGGLGCAPFPLLARRAFAAGASRVVVLSGAATADRLYPAMRFARGDARVEVREATDDGSRGHHGRVTELVEDALAEAPSVLAACGPNPMLVALASVLESTTGKPPVCEASLEAPMGCGFGTCLGCALPVRSEAGAAGEPVWALCCREGPVMAVEKVDWAALRRLPPPSVA